MTDYLNPLYPPAQAAGSAIVLGASGGLDDVAASAILGVVHGLSALAVGSFVDYLGAKLPC